MTNDFSPIEPTESEGSMFAPIPSWERGKKRRGLGARTSRVPAEPRSFVADDLTPTRPLTPAESTRAYEARMDTVDPTDTDTAFAAAPVYAASTARRGNGAGPILVAAGVILVGGLAAAGWYATQNHNAGVAELTPGTTSTTTTQVASTAPADQLAPPPAAVPPASAAPARSVTTTTTRAPAGSVSHTTVARARPAAESSADASATAPIRRAPAPMPAQAAPSAAPPAAAAAPAPLVLNIPQAAPATSAPAETPVTPQTTQAPPPTQTPPN